MNEFLRAAIEEAELGLGGGGRQARRSSYRAADDVLVAINLKTAKALGLTISPSLLLRADHVIE